MNTNLQLPKPTTTIRRIRLLQQTLYKELSSFLGKKLVDATFHSFIDRLHFFLPDTILRGTVFDSNKSLIEATLTPALLKKTCLRMAGNLDLLSMQEAVPLWQSQSKYEWVLADIIQVRPARRRNEIATSLTFRILSGTPVTCTLKQVWSNRKLHYLSKYRDKKNYGFGFGRSKFDSRGQQKGRLLFVDSRQFFGLHCLLLIDPKLSKDTPMASEVGHTSATMSYNRSLIVKRDRAETACVKNLPGSPECFLCPFGTDRCLCATHETTYKVEVCQQCQKKAFFDISDIEYKSLCIDCARKERLSG